MMRTLALVGFCSGAWVVGLAAAVWIIGRLW